MKVGELGDFEGKVWARDGSILHNSDSVDIHCFTAVNTRGIPYDQITEIIRDSMKPVGFGIVYGITAMSIAEDLGISVRKAQQLIDGWLATFPKVAPFLKQCEAYIARYKFMDTFYGRRRYVPAYAEGFGLEELRRFGIIRQLTNHCVQGGSADITRMAMVRVKDAITKAAIPAKVVLQIHDEIILKTKRKFMQEAAHLLEEGMKTTINGVRLTATARAATTLSKSAKNLLLET